MLVNQVASLPNPVKIPSQESVDPKIWQVSQQLEASFIAEMLDAAGVGKTPESFGGGVGEDQFGSYLQDAYATHISEAGGIGLSQQLYDSMRHLINEA